MKNPYLISLAIWVASCNTGQKLFEKSTSENEKIIAKKEFFSGIHYIYIEKKVNRKLQYSIIYDCECRSPNKIALHKTLVKKDGTHESWISVTDTSGQMKMFNDAIDKNRLQVPDAFMPITQEEISLLEEALNKVELSCCKNPDKPVNKIIGYVKLRVN